MKLYRLLQKKMHVDLPSSDQIQVWLFHYEHILMPEDIKTRNA